MPRAPAWLLRYPRFSTVRRAAYAPVYADR